MATDIIITTRDAKRISGVVATDGHVCVKSPYGGWVNAASIADGWTSEDGRIECACCGWPLDYNAECSNRLCVASDVMGAVK